MAKAYVKKMTLPDSQPKSESLNITVQEPESRSKRSRWGRGKKKWTPGEEATLIEMKSKGCDMQEIADALGKKVEAVRSKYRYMKNRGEV